MSFHSLFRTKAIEAARLQSRYLNHSLTPLYEYTPEGEETQLLGHCTNCGMRVNVDSARRSLHGEGLHLPCDHNSLRCIESRAWIISKNPALMMRRFEQELEQFDEAQRALFEDGDFQPLNYALFSRDGVWSLRYEVRELPDEPIGEDNRQSAGGIVTLEREVPDESMQWSRYIGPRLNPNGHENSQFWLVLPLESGEYGWGYWDSQAQWRFRREDGVVGYYVSHRDCVIEEKPQFEFLHHPSNFKIPRETLFEEDELPRSHAYP
jgi:hypothetical protein